MADQAGPHLSVDPLVTTISGRLGRDAGAWVYVPVDVPPGVFAERGFCEHRRDQHPHGLTS